MSSIKVGMKVIPSKSWGSNKTEIKEGYITKIFKNEYEIVIPQYIDEETKTFRTLQYFLVYKHEVDVVGVHITQEEIKDSVVESVREDLLARSKIGIRKYNTTLEREDFSLKDWLQHAYEECLDQANYLKAAIIKIDNIDSEQNYKT